MQRKRILWVIAVTLVLGIGGLAASVELWPEKKGTSPKPSTPRTAAVTNDPGPVKPATAAPPAPSAPEKHAAAPESKTTAKGTPSVVQQAQAPGYYIDSKTGERKEMPFTIIATPQFGPGGQPIVGKALSVEPTKPVTPAPGETAPPAPSDSTEEKKPE